MSKAIALIVVGLCVDPRAVHDARGLRGHLDKRASPDAVGGLAGRLVNNRTGLKGFYELTLTFSSPRQPGDTSPPDDALEFFTALEEQLGLKLRPEKTMVPILVIDHLERPTDN